MPKPVSLTSPVVRFTRILAGLMSLWTRPRRWTSPSVAAMLIARRKKFPTSMGAPRRGSSGSPPGSSSTSMARRGRARAAAPPKHRPTRPSIRIRGSDERGLRVTGAPRREARPARRTGCHRRLGAILGRIRVRRPPTRPGGRDLPQRRPERVGPIAALRRQGGYRHRPQQATSLCSDWPSPACIGGLLQTRLLNDALQRTYGQRAHQRGCETPRVCCDHRSLACSKPTSPDHTTLSRCSGGLTTLPKRIDRIEPLHLLADSTGLKILWRGRMARLRPDPLTRKPNSGEHDRRYCLRG